MFANALVLASALALSAPAADVVLPASPSAQFEIAIGRGGERLQLEEFHPLAAGARLVVASASGESSIPAPAVRIFRGHLDGDATGRALITLYPDGRVSGFVTSAGAAPRVLRSTGIAGQANFESVRAEAGLPAAVRELCATIESAAPTRTATLPNAAALPGPRRAPLAIEGDQAYVEIFQGDVTAATEYAILLTSLVSDIYHREVGVDFEIAFLRLWPEGGEPFSADNVGSLESFWSKPGSNAAAYSVVHLLSGRYDLPYGGVANSIGGICRGTSYSISGNLSGSTPLDVSGPPRWDVWDVEVMTHELGHNFGAPHTHSLSPPADNCGNGTPGRGTIMSYCHIHPGGLLNTDLRFHARNRAQIVAEILRASCLWRDCNGNGVSDATDIADGVAIDANGDGAPDGCQDCDHDGLLDPAEIVAGAPDLDADGIPDGCETDCNANAKPDHWETATGQTGDDDGDNVPDSCQSDCDADLAADRIEILSGAALDADRNWLPDACDDCNGNGTWDYFDLGRPGAVYVADQAGWVRELQGFSGVPLRSLGVGKLVGPTGLAFGADGRLYVAELSANRVSRIDLATEAVETFIASGLDGPAALLFEANGDLLVLGANRGDVQRFDGGTGAAKGTLVAAGKLSFPFAMTRTPSGDLAIGSSDDAIHLFSGLTGAFLRTLVAPRAGGLRGVRGLAVLDNRLIATSQASDDLVAFDLDSGEPIASLAIDTPPEGPWGVAVGLRGELLVVTTETNRVREYDLGSRRNVRSLLRADPGLTDPTGIAVRWPNATADCNGNGRFDACELADGSSVDADGDGAPDDCQPCRGMALQRCRPDRLD